MPKRAASRIVASASPSRPMTGHPARMAPDASIDPDPSYPLPRLAVVPRALARARDLSGVDFRLTILLMARGARKVPLAISQQTLAAVLGVDRRTVRDSVARLQTAGVLECIRNTRDPDGQYRRMAYHLTY